jgi:O-methyltransferase
MSSDMTRTLLRCEHAGRQTGPNPISSLRPVLDKVRPLTMVSEQSLVDLADLASVILRDDVPGDFVECGVWRGGVAFLLAEILRQGRVPDRKVWLLDSFEGLPLPQDIDGRAAKEYASNPDNGSYQDNCRASLEDVQRNAEELGLLAYSEFVKGWFEQTVPATRDRIHRIALLHIDCDWYSSVRCCLEHLYDKVVDGGFVILDDYYSYDGCAIALHEFLAQRRLTHRIHSVVSDWGGCEYYRYVVLRKGDPNWKWRRLLSLARKDVEALIPSGETIILVDDDQFGREIAGERHVIHFFRGEGRESGVPPDEGSAIDELDRLRQLGGRFLVIAWPAFWWLDCSSALAEYLRAKFRQVLKNDRVVVFDLRG